MAKENKNVIFMPNFVDGAGVIEKYSAAIASSKVDDKKDEKPLLTS